MVASKYLRVITSKWSFYLEEKINIQGKYKVKEEKMTNVKDNDHYKDEVISLPILQLSGTERKRWIWTVWIPNEANAVERNLRAVVASSSEPRVNIFSKLT